MGHLPLPYRVDLMKQIGSTQVVQKILCECCKRVYPLWKNRFDMETPLHKVLSDADNYLYKGKGSAKGYIGFSGKMAQLCRATLGNELPDCPETGCATFG